MQCNIGLTFFPRRPRPLRWHRFHNPPADEEPSVNMSSIASGAASEEPSDTMSSIPPGGAQMNPGPQAPQTPEETPGGRPTESREMRREFVRPAPTLGGSRPDIARHTCDWVDIDLT